VDSDRFGSGLRQDAAHLLDNLGRWDAAIAIYQEDKVVREHLFRVDDVRGVAADLLMKAAFLQDRNR
jgi:hypothetical protein